MLAPWYGCLHSEIKENNRKRSFGFEEVGQLSNVLWTLSPYLQNVPLQHPTDRKGWSSCWVAYDSALCLSGSRVFWQRWSTISQLVEAPALLALFFLHVLNSKIIPNRLNESRCLLCWPLSHPEVRKPGLLTKASRDQVFSLKEKKL